MIKMVIPKWILFRTNNSKLKLSGKVEKKILNSEILKVERNCKYLGSAGLYYSSKLKGVFSLEDFDKFYNYVEEVLLEKRIK